MFTQGRIFDTVGTLNKGQLIFWENGSNKGISGIPLFVIFKEPRQIRDFSRLYPVEVALFDYKSLSLAVNNFLDYVFSWLRSFYSEISKEF